jgi:pimeloyl-ACP methyl ester carboxylesterase
MSPVVLGQDSRVRAAVLASGGFSPGKAPPEVDPFNFAPRVSVPVLMINGDRDYIFDVQISQNPLFEVLGTPADRKRHLVLEASHAVFIEKRNQMIRDALDWFDRYLGPVQ